MAETLNSIIEQRKLILVDFAKKLPLYSSCSLLRMDFGVAYLSPEAIR
jgi:hypothetical protein